MPPPLLRCLIDIFYQIYRSFQLEEEPWRDVLEMRIPAKAARETDMKAAAVPL
jgi:hypothetical protein